jgi:hypothetical protein
MVSINDMDYSALNAAEYLKEVTQRETESNNDVNTI